MMRSNSSSGDDGRHAGRGLVQHQHPRPGHQRAADRHLLALAAGQLTGRLPPLLAQHREQVGTPGLDGGGDVVLTDERTHLQVLLHGHRPEHVARSAARSPCPSAARACGASDVMSSPASRTRIRSAVAACPNTRLHGGGLSGAVGAHDHRDLAGVHGHGTAAQNVGTAVASGQRRSVADQQAHGRTPGGRGVRVTEPEPR